VDYIFSAAKPTARGLSEGADTMYTGDIVIHIDESLGDDRICNLERDLCGEEGVVSACVHDKRRHLMLVDYDPADRSPSEILGAVRRRGLHAEVIGF